MIFTVDKIDIAEQIQGQTDREAHRNKVKKYGIQLNFVRHQFPFELYGNKFERMDF